MRQILRYGLTAAASGGLLVVSLSAQSSTAIDKSYMGTWKMNVAKSSGENATPPREQTRIHEDSGNGFVLVTQDTVNAQGQKGHTEYVYKPDGKDYPMAGPNQQGIVRIALKSVDPYTVTYQIKTDGKVTTDGKRVVSKDGMTMTIENTSTNAQGQRVHTVAFYDKQPAKSMTQQ